MDPLQAIGAAILLLIGIFTSIKQTSGVIKENDKSTGNAPNFDDKFELYGSRYGVSPSLLKAIASVESSMNPQAISTAPAYGLMQILCRADCPTCPCKNRLNIPEWNEATPERLLNDTDFNIRIGTQILAWNIRTYGLAKGVAVYNNWGARNDPYGGPFRNQGYVDRVFSRKGGIHTESV